MYLIISEKCNLVLRVFNSLGQFSNYFDVELHYENL